MFCNDAKAGAGDITATGSAEKGKISSADFAIDKLPEAADRLGMSRVFQILAKKNNHFNMYAVII